MAHAEPIQLTDADTKMPAGLSAWGTRSLILGLVALGLGIAGDVGHFHFGYLTAFYFWLTLTLGGLVFTLLQHVARAGWSVAVRRTAENVIGNFPILFLLFLPILVLTATGSSTIYKWNDPATVEFDQTFMPAKLGVYTHYLNSTFWTARIIGYFAIWILLSLLFRGQSRSQDQDGDHTRTRKMEILSAPGLLLFALTSTFAGIDILMSLDPHWFSTIWGIYLFAGSMTSFLSFLALTLMLIQRHGGLKMVTKEHFHDVGKLLFGFTFFFGYIGFSQYLLIWYADIPEETIFYKHRQEGSWAAFSVILLFGHFIIPFLGLLSRHVKRNKASLAFWAVWMLVMHFVDMYWIVMPTLAQKLGHADAIPFSWTHVAMWLGMGGVLFGLMLKRAGDQSIVPVRDPRLAESLSFQNI
jgi:hypothetical protein